MKGRMLVAAFVALFVAGCSGYNQMGKKEQTGTVVGGASGALIGSQLGHGSERLLGAAVGGVAGALLGQKVGQHLDTRDQKTMQQTARDTLETARTNETRTWRNPDTGNSGGITPTRTYKSAQGQDCRDYVQTVTIEGREERVQGTACRQEDGTWRIVSGDAPPVGVGEAPPAGRW